MKGLIEMQKGKSSPMEKLAAFIVDKRNLFFLLYIFALVFCFFSTEWVKVENDITTYLPAETETRRGLTIMNEQPVRSQSTIFNGVWGAENAPAGRCKT